MTSMMPPTGRCKVARCPTCHRIAMAAAVPAGDTSPATLREFARLVRKGYEVAYIDDPAEVRKNWGECPHMVPELGQGTLFA